MLGTVIDAIRLGSGTVCVNIVLNPFSVLGGKLHICVVVDKAVVVVLIQLLLRPIAPVSDHIFHHFGPELAYLTPVKLSFVHITQRVLVR